MNILLRQAFSFFTFGTLILLVCAGMLLALRYGAVAGYIGFAWVLPVAAALWLNFEYELFGTSMLNLPFVYTLVTLSFILSVICFPLLIISRWGELPILIMAGLSLSAFLHGIPFGIYLLARGKRPGQRIAM